MSYFATDNFDRTGNLAGSTASGGGTWSRVKGDLEATCVSPGRLRSSQDSCAYVHSATPPSADYDVVAKVKTDTAAHDSFALLARYSASAGATTGGYRVIYKADRSLWVIQYWDATWGSCQKADTNEATYSGDAPTTERTITVRLSGTSIKLLIDGVERIAAVDARFADAGLVGIFENYLAAHADLYLDDFQAGTADAGGDPTVGWYTVTG